MGARAEVKRLSISSCNHASNLSGSLADHNARSHRRNQGDAWQHRRVRQTQAVNSVNFQLPIYNGGSVDPHSRGTRRMMKADNTVPDETLQFTTPEIARLHLTPSERDRASKNERTTFMDNCSELTPPSPFASWTIDHIGLRTSDFDAAVAWYTEKLDCCLSRAQVGEWPSDYSHCEQATIQN